MVKQRWKNRCITAMLGACLAAPLVSCSEDDESVVQYDPNKPIVCESFSPSGGPISTQVILTGENFGQNKSLVKCYFNEKEAPVLGVNDDHALVLAPRLPGENVVIKLMVGTVENGDTTYQENTFKGFFDYEIRTNISTICGGDASATENSAPNVGDIVSLSEAQFSNSMDNNIAVDKQKNIYFGFDKYRYCANEAADRLKNIDEMGTFLTVAQVIYNPITDRVYHSQANIGNNETWWWDPNNDFARMDKGDIQWDNNDFIPEGMASWAARRTAAVNPEDGLFYARTYGGYLIRWDPATAMGENLTEIYGGVGIGTTTGSTYGIVFLPSQPNVMYFSNDELDCIFKLDLNTGQQSVYAGQRNTAGYLDGPANQAQFNSPHQMCIDSEENIYVTDTENHCIRKINTKTGYVSTVAGIPQSAGYINGTSETAKFNRPVGIAIDTDGILYVGDCNNHAIRRVAIE